MDSILERSVGGASEMVFLLHIATYFPLTGVLFHLRHHELALFGGLLRRRILTMLSGVCGLLEVTLMASKRRKEPDAVQAVRDWLEKTQKEFSKQCGLPQKKWTRRAQLIVG